MVEPKYLLLGEVLRPHGVRGELRMRILTDYPERINDLESVYLGTDTHSDDVTPYRVQHMRMHKAYGLLKLQGIDSREQADLLRQLFVMIDLEHAVPLEEDEFYLFQLIGLNIQTEDKEPLGILREVLETGANDVYIVDSPQHGEILIPVLDETVLEINFEEQFVIVRLPEGLLPQ